MRRILFVDDEPNVLHGLRRMLRPYRYEWDMRFAQSGEEALRFLSDQNIDVVFSEMRMQGMDGAALFAAIRREHPRVVRIILSGHADQRLALRTIETAHQYLSKPCDPRTLKQTVDRACALQGVLENAVLKGIVSQIESLPSPPAAYTEINEALQHPNVSTRRVGDIIAQDAAMTAKVLQLVNSSFFGLPRRVSSAVQAVAYLGIETLRNLVLSVHVFSRFGENSASFRLDRLRKHCLSAAALARAIALAQDSSHPVVADAMTGGLLHDVGKLVLIDALPERFAEANKQACEHGTALWEEERKLLGATHAEVGAYLLGLWGLPGSIVEAVAFHHRPSASRVREFDSLTAVHVADALLHELEPTGVYGGGGRLDLNHVVRLGLTGRLAAWRDLCQRVIHEGPIHV